MVKTKPQSRITQCCTVFAAATLLYAAPLSAQPAQVAAIRTVLEKQAADWNRGDLDAFAAGYKQAPDILFMGKTLSHGYAQMLASYRQHYATRAQMGTLSFSKLEIQPLDARFATVTGNYHLERSSDEGNADGYYLLVLERTRAGWKIIRDDTTSLPKTPQ